MVPGITIACICVLFADKPVDVTHEHAPEREVEVRILPVTMNAGTSMGVKTGIGAPVLITP